MSEAGERRMMIVVSGMCCVLGLACAGVILDDMVRHSGVSGPGCVFALIEAAVAGWCGCVTWGVYHD